MTPEPQTPTSLPTAPVPVAAAPPRELDIFAYVILLLRHTAFILGCGLVGFLFMVVVMLNTKPRFASTAVMIVPQGNVTSQNLTAQLALSTADLLGGGYELYADIIKSRTVEDRLIASHDLLKVYGVTRIADAENILNSLTSVVASREGLVTVTVQDGNAQRAADLANDYLKQLDVLNSNLVLTSIGLQRLYLYKEMTAEKDQLADAEIALQQVQEKTTGLPPEAEANAGLSALESTRAQYRADTIHLQALLTSDTDANPEVVRLRSQIAAEAGQLHQLENGANNVENGTPTAKLPEQALEYTRRLRDVKFHDTLFNLLASQYEAAKEQEAKNPSIVQVLDAAVPSDRKAWPPRTYFCLMAGIIGLVVGIMLVSIRGAVLAYLRNPRNAARIQQLKSIYRFPRRRAA
jgi:tyrosine-protein kinase Etk/Wzc